MSSASHTLLSCSFCFLQPRSKFFCLIPSHPMCCAPFRTVLSRPASPRLSCLPPFNLVLFCPIETRPVFSRASPFHLVPFRSVFPHPVSYPFVRSSIFSSYCLLYLFVSSCSVLSSPFPLIHIRYFFSVPSFPVQSVAVWSSGIISVRSCSVPFLSRPVQTRSVIFRLVSLHLSRYVPSSPILLHSGD